MPPARMTNSFDRLEKLFSPSKRREKATQEREALRRKASEGLPPIPSASNGPMFPGASFMKPTSMRMTPRSPTVDKEPYKPLLSLGKERSQSLPQNRLRRESSTCTAVKTRKSDSSRPSSFALDAQKDRDAAIRLSEFRFPEDMLFRHDKSDRLSTELAPDERPGVEPPSIVLKRQSPNRGLLDWSPQHISLAFNPFDVPSTGNVEELGPCDDESEPKVLMPSPLPRPLTSDSTRSQQDESNNRIPQKSSRSSIMPLERSWSLFPTQYVPVRFPAPPTYSPPASDSDSDCTPVSERSMSLSALSAANDFTPTTTPDRSPPAAPGTAITCEGKKVRGSWDAGLAQLRNISTIPKSPLRRTKSDVTLATMTPRVTIRHVLLEPSINEVLALSDDDVAEPWPATLAPGTMAPPTPPPKDDIMKLPLSKGKTPIYARAPRNTSINPTSGEITPPITPTDAKFITSPGCAPSPAVLGAVKAASIAKKYNFDLVYLISAYPSSGCRGKLATNCRYLAAFGLGDLPQPFKCPAPIHQGILGSEGWREFRDPTGYKLIEHGWMCSLQSDDVEERGSAPGTSSKTDDLVFAAYTKRGNKSIIPSESRPARTHLLKELSVDARGLVEITTGRQP